MNAATATTAEAPPTTTTRFAATATSLDSLGLLYCQPTLRVARVQRRHRLKQDHVDLLLCDRPMLGVARNDDELPLLDGYAPIPKLHREPALLDQKEFVLVLVPVPDERALELDELHVVSVHLPDDLRVPMGREQGELLRQVDLIHASSARPLVRATAGSRSLPFRCAQAVPHASQLHRVLRSVTKEQGH